MISNLSRDFFCRTARRYVSRTFLNRVGRASSSGFTTHAPKVPASVLESSTRARCSTSRKWVKSCRMQRPISCPRRHSGGRLWGIPQELSSGHSPGHFPAPASEPPSQPPGAFPAPRPSLRSEASKAPLASSNKAGLAARPAGLREGGARNNSRARSGLESPTLESLTLESLTLESPTLDLLPRARGSKRPTLP